MQEREGELLGGALECTRGPLAFVKTRRVRETEAFMVKERSRVAVLLGAAWGWKFSVIDFIFSVKYESRSLTESEDGRGGDGDWRQTSVRWSPRTVGESD